MGVQEDQSHVQLLAIFHFVVAGIAALCLLFPGIYIALGLALVSGNLDEGNSPPPEMGWIFVVFGLALMVPLLLLAVGMVMAGFRLLRRKGHLFCMVMAGVECIFMPFGTVLGIFSLIVLMRPSVKQMFGVEGFEAVPAEPVDFQ